MDLNDIRKEYSNDEITVIWQSAKCIHSGNCARNLAGVFRPKEQPWIKMENSTSADIIDTVNKCPSGALSFVRKK